MPNLIQPMQPPQPLSIRSVHACCDPNLDALIAWDSEDKGFLLLEIEGIPSASARVSNSATWEQVNAGITPPQIEEEVVYLYDDLSFIPDQEKVFPTLYGQVWFWAFPGRVKSCDDDDPAEPCSD